MRQDGDCCLFLILWDYGDQMSHSTFFIVIFLDVITGFRYPLDKVLNVQKFLQQEIFNTDQ